MTRLRARKPPKGKRTASGRPSRSKEALAANAQDVRQNNLEARKRAFGVSYVQAANPQFGTALFHFRTLASDYGAPLNAQEVAAFEWLEQAYDRYKKAIASPAAVFEPAEGLTARPSDAALAASARRAVDQWRGAVAAIEKDLGKHRRDMALDQLVRGALDPAVLPLARRALIIVIGYLTINNR